jgi:hypothetical protein
MKKNSKSLWKKYRTFAKKQGWKNLSKPKHLGSFCYGAICLVLSIPVLVFAAYNAIFKGIKKL